MFGSQILDKDGRKPVYLRAASFLGNDMYKVRTVVIAVVFICCAVSVNSANAQGARYRPHTPKFSPYLDYFKRDRGALDVYNSIVRPNQEIRSEFARQRRGLTEQRGQIEQLQQQNRGRGDLAPTGVGARFMDFSHFYPSRQLRR